MLRPADATETVEAWRVAMARTGGPTLLVLTRQKLPVLDRATLGAAAGTARGAYVLLDPPGGNPQAILIATGSEVHVALAAAKLLQADRVRVRVVSMPSWELFAAQPEAYRNEVLPPGVRVRLGIEAASAFGWERWIGDRRRHARHGGLRRLRAGRSAVPGVQVHPGARRGDGAPTAASQTDGMTGMTNPLVRLGELGPEPLVRLHHPRPRRPPASCARLIRDDGLRGMTSNPTIFEKAIAGSRLTMTTSAAEPTQGRSPQEIFERLAVADVRAACDAFAPVYQASGGGDGLVSLEVSPTLANDTARHHPRGRAALARGRPAQRDDQDPRHARGAAGDHALHRRRHQRQRHAALLGRALRRGHRGVPRGPRAAARAQGCRSAPITSVASFFVSRVDGKVDPLLDRLGDPAKLRGRIAIANACAAYRLFEWSLGTPRWEPAGQGRRPAAAAALGLDQHQGPALSRRALRRGAGRAADGEHPAARDVRRLPRPRPARPCGSTRGWPRRRASSRRWRPRASTSRPSPASWSATA